MERTSSFKRKAASQVPSDKQHPGLVDHTGAPLEGSAGSARQRTASRTAAQPRVPPKLQGSTKQMTQRDWKATADWLAVDIEEGLMAASLFERYQEAFELKPHWHPQASLLHNVGFKAADFRRLMQTRPQVFASTANTIKGKLVFLQQELGLSNEHLVKVLRKYPMVLDFKIERSLRPSINFLRQHGLTKEELCKLAQRAPRTLTRNADSAAKLVGILTARCGVPEESIGKVLTRSPAVLSLSEDGLVERVEFLEALGLSQEQLAKVTVAHPQILHYSTDCMEERLEFLQRIGMSSEEVVLAVARLPQLLCLDIEANLQPKYRYLLNELGGSVKSICTFPAYFSLSLYQRIMPRHRYLQVVRAEALHPLRLNHYKMSDEQFVKQAARTSMSHFESFQSHFAERLALRQRR